MPGVLVIGVGNALRHDDAAGLEVAPRRVQAMRRAAACGGDRASASTRARRSACSSAGRAPTRWSSPTRSTAAAPPGTIHRFDVSAGRSPRRSGRLDLHARDRRSPRRSSWRARSAACRRRIVVYGVEGARFDAGSGLSAGAVRARSRRSPRRVLSEARCQPRCRDRRLAVGDRRRRSAAARAAAARAGPPAASRSRQRSSSRRFWKTPPESTTVPSPSRSASIASARAGRLGQSVVEAGADERRRRSRVRGRRRSPGPSRAGRAAACSPSCTRQRVAAPLGRVGEPPRAPSPPAPPRRDSRRSPHSAATASNRRPTLLVSGEATPVRSSWQTWRPALRVQARRAAPGAAAGAPSPAAASQEQAIRHGSRAAASPPGSRTGAGARPGGRLSSPPASSSPPQIVPSLPSPAPS